MTVLEAQIFDFLKQETNLSYLLIPFQTLVNSHLLPAQSFGLLKRLLKSKDITAIEAHLLQYFKKYQIDYLEREQYLAKERQKVFRLKNKDKLKQLNFYLDMDTYKKLQSIKGKKTYNQIIKELLAK